MMLLVKEKFAKTPFLCSEKKSGKIPAEAINLSIFGGTRSSGRFVFAKQNQPEILTNSENDILVSLVWRNFIQRD